MTKVYCCMLIFLRGLGKLEKCETEMLREIFIEYLGKKCFLEKINFISKMYVVNVTGMSKKLIYMEMDFLGY